MISLDSTTAEKLLVVITTPVDPTGTAPEFSIAASNPGTWVSGAWSGSWDSTTGIVNALTPLIGSGQSLDITEGTQYQLFVRWHASSEIPVRVAATIKAV